MFLCDAMIVFMVMPTVTILRKVSGRDKLIVIKKSDHSLYRQRQDEMGDALDKVRRGREEYRRGETVTFVTHGKLH